MAVSSGPSPMAYVLSEYITNPSCTGVHLFKFDPLSFSSTAVWIKKSVVTTNCGNRGLVFGLN
jgi:hypothetical protein